MLILLSPNLGLQQRHEITVRNIMVPLRVYEGNRFIQNLTIDDLEIFENGVKQRIQALYLVNKNRIERKEVLLDFSPTTARRFYFLFHISEYNAKIGDAIEYFFENIFQPGDQVILMTPIKTYAVSKTAIRSKDKKTIAQDMSAAIRRDTQVGVSEYNGLLSDLRRLVGLLATPKSQERLIFDLESSGGTQPDTLQYLLNRYRNSLQNIEELRLINEPKLIKFANQIKNIRYQTVVFFFYQREFRPEIHATVLDRLLFDNQHDPAALSLLSDLFQFFHRRININSQRIVREFSDSKAMFNLLFFNKPQVNYTGIFMREQSEDIFRLFSQVAVATGGIVDNTQNPESALKKATPIINRFYLIYYSPTKYLPDGSFKNISMRVKDKKYRIIHRLGYFAD
jgi:hypothetical protein